MKRTPHLKVLQVIHALGMGGAETWLIEVLRLWAADGSAQMHFLCTGGESAMFDDEARRLGAQIHYVPYGRIHLRRFAATFRKILRHERYSAIHDHQDYASGWHFLIGAGCLPPVRITHVHNPSYQIDHNYAVTPARRFAARGGKMLARSFATHVLGTSKQVLREYGFEPPKRRQHVGPLHCGFDQRRFFGDPSAEKRRLCEEFRWPADSRIILFAGRIDRSADPSDPQAHKNAPFALNVGLECAKRDQRIRMIFAGRLSPAVPALEQQIANAGCSRRIVFAGVRRDIDTLMLGSDVLLFPSRGEGLGMVAVEAQAAGLPVIASTAVPSECVVIPELVRFLSLTEDVETWARSTVEALCSPRLSVSGCNARIDCSPFAIKNSAALLRAVYAGGVGVSA